MKYINIFNHRLILLYITVTYIYKYTFLNNVKVVIKFNKQHFSYFQIKLKTILLRS